MPRPLSAEARQKAIDATQTLVAECGISGFTLDGVARRSGVAKTTLYRHWSSGNELLVHALDCQVEHLPTPNTGSLKGDLTEFLTMLASIANVPSNRQLMLDMLSAAAKDAELAAVHEAMWVERTRPVREMIERAVDRGEIPAIESNLAMLMIEGPFLAMVMTSSDPIDVAMLPKVADLIVRSFGARA